MPRTCEVTGKKAGKGHKYAIRGIAKKKKGIGLNITGKTRRSFQPNMISKRLWLAEENRFITIKMTAAGLRTIDKVGLANVVKKIRKSGGSV
jgi:large subunit ribosomal protein L28